MAEQIEPPNSSHGDDGDSEIELAWEAEAERRYRQYVAGQVDSVSADDALVEIRVELSSPPGPSRDAV